MANPTGTYDTDKAEDSVALFLEMRYQHHEPWNSENLLQTTREDLAKLESDFARYLSDEVETSKGYKEKVSELMERIGWTTPRLFHSPKPTDSWRSISLTLENSFMFQYPAFPWLAEPR